MPDKRLLKRRLTRNGFGRKILSRDSSARFRAPSKRQSRQRGTVLITTFEIRLRLLQQREYLRVRTIRIPRAGDLATRTHVLAGAA